MRVRQTYTNLQRIVVTTQFSTACPEWVARRLALEPMEISAVLEDQAGNGHQGSDARLDRIDVATDVALAEGQDRAVPGEDDPSA
jgi:hypothetical protein